MLNSDFDAHLELKQNCRWHRDLTTICLIFIALAIAPVAHPAEKIVYSTDIAPFFYVPNAKPFLLEQGFRPGAVNELLGLAARDSNLTLDIQALPFRRLYAQLDSHPEMLAVMWRLPEVEPSRRWLAKLLSEQLVVVARGDSSVDVHDLALVRKLHIGVVRGGPAELVLRRLGFTNVETASYAESNARKLAIGRIDAWVAFRSVAADAQLRIGSDLHAVRFGAVLQNVDLYLTSGLDSDPGESARWRDTFRRLSNEGRQQDLLRHYHLKVDADIRP